jgi:transcriptional regulator PpsR
MILCRLDPVAHIVPATEDLLESLNALYEQTSDAIVFTDARGVILHANDGFLALCDIVRVTDLDGATLADYLLRGIIDQRVLLENAASAGRVSMFATRLKSANGTEVAVEIGAAFLGEGNERAFGFVIRDRSRAEATAEMPENTDAMNNAMDLVGTAPLKELVAATADVVEKMCIETAVKLTDNNRVAAAELLGLSRQSFYVRLRKYGMLKKDED